MYKYFNKIIDVWVEKCNDKMKLAYQTETTLPTVYKVINKDGYNLAIIAQMWADIQEYLTDRDKLEIMAILNLF